MKPPIGRQVPILNHADGYFVSCYTHFQFHKKLSIYKLLHFNIFHYFTMCPNLNGELRCRTSLLQATFVDLPVAIFTLRYLLIGLGAVLLLKSVLSGLQATSWHNVTCAAVLSRTLRHSPSTERKPMGHLTARPSHSY